MLLVQNTTLSPGGYHVGQRAAERGLIWRIGDGFKMSVWADKWIPRIGSCRTLGFKDNTHIYRVSDLWMNREGTGANLQFRGSSMIRVQNIFSRWSLADQTRETM